MSHLYGTVGQKQIQRAVGKVISMAGYRRLTLSGDGYGPGDGPDKAAEEESECGLTH
jgi:hypothetical protein